MNNMGSSVVPREAPWTEEQWEAITTRHKDLLVSAAAGTGKTAVLVRRVIFLVMHPTDPIDIDRLLIVTFTDAAAAEMKERIGRALEKELDSAPESTRLARQLALVNKADISTLHSFCHRIIRQYFYRLNIDPVFRGMDDTESRLLQLEVLDDLFEHYYDDFDFGEEFTDLVDRYGGRRGDENIKDLVLQVYNLSRSRPDPDMWLSRLLSKFSVPPGTSIDNLEWVDFALSSISRKVSAAYGNLSRALEIAGMPCGPNNYVGLLRKEFNACGEVLDACKKADWERIACLLDMFKFDRLPNVRQGDCDEVLKNSVQNLRNEAKGLMTLKDDYFSGFPQRFIDELRSLRPCMKTFVDVVKGFSSAYTREKRKKNLVDFGDMEHLCLKVLREWDESKGEWGKSDIAKELSDKYSEVLVDEYQDINAVQNEILQFVSSECNSFAVGDVKQSIYRFRLAEPKLFMEKYKNYSKPDQDNPGRCIDLSRNFRSRRAIIDSVNFIFRQVFSKGVGEIDYDTDAELAFGADYPRLQPGLFRGDYDNPPVEVYLIDRDTTYEDIEESQDESESGGNLEEFEALRLEAHLIAQRISEMVRGTDKKPGPEFQVWDKKVGSYRPVSYRDIVVLMRATRNRANILSDVFRQADIPAYAELGTGYFEAVEVETMLSLLKIIDNPRQDIPLAAILRSPIGGFSHDDLVRIRLCKKDGNFYQALDAARSECGEGELGSKAAGFLLKLESWRTVARKVPLSTLVWQLYRDTDYLDYVSGMPGGTQRAANLRAFHERARQFDRFSRQGLVRFLRFIDKLREAEGDLGTARALGEGEDVVRIMSVHKSKGLEFPVVFIADIGKGFYLKDLRSDILLHPEIGLAPVYCDPVRRIKYPTLLHHAAKEVKLREDLSEEMRILYVAMTRARERLVMVGSARNLSDQVSRWLRDLPKTGLGLPGEVIYSAGGFLDWIGMSLIRHKDGIHILESGNFHGLPFEPEILEDPSRFNINVLSASQVISEFSDLQDQKPHKPGIDWDLIVKARPLGREINNELWQKIENHACWEYPYSPLTERAAKVAWREIKRQFDFSTEDARFSGEDTIIRRFVPGRFAQGPMFLQSGDITPVERGEATHLVMQHLDLGGPLDEPGIRKNIERMVESKLLTRELALSVDVLSICDFFNAPLGIRMKAYPDRVMREIPFSLGIPASRVYPELLESASSVLEGERVLIQGIIDCVISEPDGFILIDFKTGGKPWNDPLVISRKYTGQISVYKEALETIYGIPVKEAYIYLLTMRKAVPL